MASQNHFGDDDVIMMLRKNTLDGVPIKDACRNDKCVVLTTFKGQVYQCNGDLSTSSKLENYDKVIFPTSEREDDPSVDIVNVCCGRKHFLALSADGRVYSWGWNGDGQLGIPKKKGKTLECPKPRLIKKLSDVGVIQIACGDDHSLALTRDGQLYSWGSNRRSQLGIGKGNSKKDKRLVDKPIKVECLWGVPLQCIAAGGQHSVVLATSGSVFVWGWNEDGQLGLAQSDNVKLPIKLESISQGDVKVISCGMHHTSFLKQNGQLLVYGMGVDRVPCESDKWRETELRPERFSPFSFIQSTSRCTYAVEEVTHEIFMLDHSKAQQGDSSQNLQLKPLQKALMTDMFETEAATVWPSPGSYVFDPEVWGSARPEEQLECVPRLEEQPNGDYTVTPSPDAGYYPTAATSPTGHLTQDTAYINQVSVSEVDESGINVAHQDPAENAIGDLSGAMASTSITGHDCKNKTAGDRPRLDDVDQENQQMTPRILRRLCPGQDTIFIIEQDEPMGEELHVSMTPSRGIDTLSGEFLQSLADIDGDITEDMTLFKHAKDVFSSPACLNASFRQTGQNEIGVDLKAAREAFKSINKNDSILEKLSKSIPDELCKSLPKLQNHEEVLRFILILMECPILRQHRHPWGRRVLSALGRFIISLYDASEYETLAQWWKVTPRSFRHAIKAYRKALTFLIQKRTRVEEEPKTFLTFLKVLDFLNKVNLEHDILSIKMFYIAKLDKVDFQPGQKTFGREHPLSDFRWEKYQFLIDLELKTSIFMTNNLVERQNTMADFFDGNFYGFLGWLQGWGPPVPPSAPMLTMIVDRKDIFGKSVQEQLTEMLSFPMSLLRRPLKVTFVGEAGVDLGALSMEFFRLAFKELLDPDKNKDGLVRYIDSIDTTNSFVWFQKECGNSKLAEICGLLFGLSLYNKAIVPLPFPQLLYAKLLGKGPKSEMEELEELDKDFANKMCKLQTGTEEYVNESCYGMEIELEDGRSVDVTKENVHRYVDKRIKEHLAPLQFAAFQKGFHKVFHPTACDIFRPIELETLVTGEKHFDWKALEQSTQYGVPYTPSHPNIEMFWTVFHKLDDGLKRKFLVFVAGCDRVPVGGLQKLGLIIELLLPEEDDCSNAHDVEDGPTLLMPTGHACDNFGYRRTLRLPEYTSPDALEDRLTNAISPIKNFGFHIA